MISLNSQFYFLSNQEGQYRGVVALCGDQYPSAIGGCRIIQEKFSHQIVELAHSLADTMRLKAASNHLPLNGAKAVLCANDAEEKSYLLRQLAALLNQLQGRYITAVDMGITQQDMDYLAQFTPYLTCHTEGGGDPSLCTARGVLLSMQAACQWYYGDDDLSQRHIAIQGVGKVGHLLVELLLSAGAQLTISDIDPLACQPFKSHPRVTIVPNDAIYQIPCDIFAPCAAAGVINLETIKQLQCDFIIGAANNPLSHPTLAKLLAKQGKIYLPDYLVNGGGLIHCLHQYQGDFDLESKIAAIGTAVMDCLRSATNGSLV